MLLSLRIENFALIDQLELEFGNGLNVLTGETGAGKSIILDAIDAVLGGKVPGRAVRTGAERATLEATFSLNDSLAAWLAEAEIESLGDAEDEQWMVCSRELTATQNSTRSRSRVNGVVVNRQQMDRLRDRVVEIAAQGQAVQLGKPALQREWLDGFGGQPLLQQRQVVAHAFAECQQALEALEQRRRMEAERLQQLDLLEFQARELGQADLSDANELQDLEQERQRLSHVVELQQQSYQLYQTLYENEKGQACADLLGKAETMLASMVSYDPQLQPLLEMVTGALTQVEETGRQINAYGEDLETDPDRLQLVESRILDLKQICRKYGPSLADAIACYQRVQADLEALTGGGQSLEDLERIHQERLAVLTDACTQLTHLREAAAQALEAQLIAELKPLAMEKVKFQVEITPVPPSASGADRILFLFSPNSGEPLQPLAETASGGEMSRFLLALKACFSQVDAVETMIFDEIDVGVSGRVAQAITEKLHHLSHSHQVLCVTHQPIVAAMADRHYRVDKQEIADPASGGSSSRKRSAKAGKEEAVRTVVRVTVLGEEERRLQELAQLASGDSADEAMTFAESLLNWAEERRESYQKQRSQLTKKATAKGKGQKKATIGHSKTTRKRAP